MPLYFFTTSIFRLVFRKIILSYNFILFYFSSFFLINFFYYASIKLKNIRAGNGRELNYHCFELTTSVFRSASVE
jgi:hypothetical protein